MRSRLYEHDDLRAEVTILTEAEGGRKGPAFNGIRWDLGYAEDAPSDSMYMIWPDFVDETGNSIPTDAPLPIGVLLRARFLIVNPKLRHIHQARIAVGTRFYCQEGSRRVAIGRVTKLTSLNAQDET